MITKIELRDIFNTFASTNAEIDYYNYAVNHLWEVDKDLESNGVVQWVNSKVGSVSGTISRLNYDVFLMDIVNIENDNSDEIESDTARIALDFLSNLDQYSTVTGKMFSIDRNSITIEPFRERFDSTYCGNILSFTVKVPFNYNTCLIPVNP